MDTSINGTDLAAIDKIAQQYAPTRVRMGADRLRNELQRVNNLRESAEQTDR